jgi:hypothetical protein
VAGRSTRSLAVMTREEAVIVYSALSADRQISVLAHYGHLITVAARDTYIAGTDNVSNSPRLRQSNELLHRVLAHIWHLAEGQTKRYPDDVLVSMFWGDYELVAESSQEAFERALKQHDS